jgi:HSP20 family protein
MKTAIESRSNQTQYRRIRPVVDVYESDAEYLVNVELPGVKSEEVALTLEQEGLRLEATRRANISEPVVYDRSFSLPDGVDREQVNAQLKDGVLALKLPKYPSQKPRRIQVNAA